MCRCMHMCWGGHPRAAVCTWAEGGRDRDRKRLVPVDAWRISPLPSPLLQWMFTDTSENHEALVWAGEECAQIFPWANPCLLTGQFCSSLCFYAWLCRILLVPAALQTGGALAHLPGKSTHLCNSSLFKAQLHPHLFNGALPDLSPAPLFSDSLVLTSGLVEPTAVRSRESLRNAWIWIWLSLFPALESMVLSFFVGKMEIIIAHRSPVRTTGWVNSGVAGAQHWKEMWRKRDGESFLDLFFF